MIGVVGGGAFGTALALALARDGREVRLYARRPADAAARLAGMGDAARVEIADDPARLKGAEMLLLAVPMQALSGVLSAQTEAFDGKPLVLCCKGIDLATGLGPSAVARLAFPAARLAVLTGPGFAADLARGLPTALTLASADAAMGQEAQRILSTPALRLYRSNDVTGAELGGALKNVVAIAAGVVIGAGLGQSARAALMTRGYAEMVRLALAQGARADTLAGLSGLGDLVLTCTSEQSRNFRFGQALGRGEGFDPQETVEGVATAQAAVRRGTECGVDLPVTAMVAALVERRIAVQDAVATLMSRPLKEE